jgi:lipopolysaccharide export system permease protein
MIGWLIPNSNKVRVDFEVEYLKNKYHYDKLHTHVKVSDDTYVYIKSYMNERNYGTDFSIERFEDKELVYKLQSARVKWDSTMQKWHLDRYTLRTYNNGVENLSYGTDLDTTLNLYPKDFQSSFKRQEALTLPELKAFIDEQKERGFQNIKLYEIEYYERFTYPFAIIILTALGVIVSARKSRNGIASQIMLGLVLALTFVMFIMVGRNFGHDGTLHPLITAIIPDVLFGFIAFVLYKKLPQ